jgi:hypothetical protein
LHGAFTQFLSSESGGLMDIDDLGVHGWPSLILPSVNPSQEKVQKLFEALLPNMEPNYRYLLLRRREKPVLDVDEMRPSDIAFARNIRRDVGTRLSENRGRLIFWG